jgi:glycosyltransferase involved in cell wall biosynthesis
MFPKGLGTTTRFLGLAKPLVSRGHNVHKTSLRVNESCGILACLKSSNKSYNYNGIEVFEINRQINLKYSPKPIREILRSLSFLPSLYTYAKHIETDAIVMGAPNIHEGLCSYILSRILRKPLILDYMDVFHGTVPRFITKRCDIVFAISSNLQNRIKKVSKNVYLLPGYQGGDISRFSKVDDKDLKESITFIFVGGIEPENDYLVEIVKNFGVVLKADPKTKLIIVGDGTNRIVGEPILAYFSKVIREKKLENAVELEGMVPYENIPRYLEKADVAILPDKLNEYNKYAFPTKLLEYMAAGLPVIATDVGDVSMVVKDYHNGILVKNHEEMLCKMIELVKNPSLVQKLSKNARNDVMEKYNTERLAEIFEETIKIS